MLPRQIFVCFMSVVFLNMPAAADAQIERTWEINVRGVPMFCVAYDGYRALIVVNPYLNNVGIAHRYGDQPIIQLNPNVVGRYSDRVAQFWFAHECAHHALPPQANSEANADCYAIRAMRNWGILRNRFELNAFADELWNLPGSLATGHLPGPARVNNIARCALT